MNVYAALFFFFFLIQWKLIVRVVKPQKYAIKVAHVTEQCVLNSYNIFAKRTNWNVDHKVWSHCVFSFFWLQSVCMWIQGTGICTLLHSKVQVWWIREFGEYLYAWFQLKIIYLLERKLQACATLLSNKRTVNSHVTCIKKNCQLKMLACERKRRKCNIITILIVKSKLTTALKIPLNLIRTHIIICLACCWLLHGS